MAPATDAGEAVYELGCVLYHKGSSVHSGHYVAEVHEVPLSLFYLSLVWCLRRYHSTSSHIILGKVVVVAVVERQAHDCDHGLEISG